MLLHDLNLVEIINSLPRHGNPAGQWYYSRDWDSTSGVISLLNMLVMAFFTPKFLLWLQGRCIRIFYCIEITTGWPKVALDPKQSSDPQCSGSEGFCPIQMIMNESKCVSLKSGLKDSWLFGQVVGERRRTELTILEVGEACETDHAGQ